MLAVVKPSMPGMRTSMRIAEKSSSSTRRSASSPELAVTSGGPSDFSSSCIAMRLAASSSTMRMGFWNELGMVDALARQHHERVAAQRAHRRVGTQPEERRARPLEESRLPAVAGELGAPLRVEMVDQRVAAILEGGERRLLREMVEVPDSAARVEEGARAQHFLRGELERNVEDLVVGPGAKRSQEPEVILDMLEDVDRHRDVVMLAHLEEVREAEGKALGSLLRADRERGGRDVVAEEARGGIEARAQRAQHFPRAAADLAERARHDRVALQQMRDVARLPRRIVGVPARVVGEVRAVAVDRRFHERPCSRPVMRAARDILGSHDCTTGAGRYFTRTT